MAIETYQQLQAAIANWIDRDNLGPYIPDFVSLYEAKFNRSMRLRQMETSATLTDAGGYYSLPSGIAQIRNVWNAGANPEAVLEPVAPDYALTIDPQAGSPPAYYYVTGARLYAVPANASDIGVRYYAKLTAMSADEDANWLLQAYPDAYLYGALVEAFMFQQDEQRAQLWQQRLNLVHEEIKTADAGTRWNHSSQRVSGPTP